MNLANKQITFHKPKQISAGINEGIRAIAENYNGHIQAATDHCVERIRGLTEAKLTRCRAKNPPGYTRDGQSFITLLWILLVDGLTPHRQSRAVREWLGQIIDGTDLFEGELNEESLPALIETFIQSIDFHDDIERPTPEIITRTIMQIWAADSASVDEIHRTMPILNRIFIGREDDLSIIHQRIGVDGVDNEAKRHPLTIVRGWPGVGKTALINAVAHDKAVKAAFADNVLWASLGRNGDLFDTFKDWARQLGALHLLPIQHLKDLVRGLRAVLAGRDMLVIVDDIWTEEQGLYIKQVVDLKTNTLLLATRFTDLANKLKDVPEDIYVLEVLPEAHAIELLGILAPEPARIYQHRLPQLVKVLEGLPLALRVAGPTLQHYHEMLFDIDELIDEFENDYNRLLEASAPSDRFDEETGQTPTIELLFKRSVETLSSGAHLAFMALGVFKHKPATFDANALQSVWEVDDPKTLIENLIGRGLMDTAPDSRYRIHQTLHMYANKLLDNHINGLSI